jgi:DNA (cytosine-5)-methyltransferase 1
MSQPPETRNSSDQGLLRRLRSTAGLSQSDLARRMGYDVRTIKRWENGNGSPRPYVIEFLRSLPANAPQRVSTPSAFTFVDLFAGIGGMRLGFQSAGGRCVFTSEWDKYCQLTYRANFGNAPIYGDIRTVDVTEIPDHDVLLAGFPCQPFSLAGVSKKNALGRAHGFECQTQGTLFFEIERVLEAKRPRAFLLENVKNLHSHDGGRTFRTVMRTLQRLGYSVYPKVLNARSFVPQHRERIYLVGFCEDVDFSWEEDLQLPPQSSWPILGSILHPEDGSELPEPPYTEESGKVAARYVLSGPLWQYLQKYESRHRASGHGFGYSLADPNDVSRTLSARYYKDGSEILIARDIGSPRRLTPRECARLMGFDSGNRTFGIPVSDTQAYKQFGNSVVVPMIEAIARSMRPYIIGQSTARTQFRLDLASV